MHNQTTAANKWLSRKCAKCYFLWFLDNLTLAQTLNLIVYLLVVNDLVNMHSHD